MILAATPSHNPHHVRMPFPALQYSSTPVLQNSITPSSYGMSVSSKRNRMIFYGINPIMEALRAQHPLQHIYVVDRKSSPAITKILNLAKRQGVLIKRVPDMRGICKSPDHQGVCAECEDLGTTTLPLKLIDVDRIVMLDGIEDPHNLGASLQVCEGRAFRDSAPGRFIVAYSDARQPQLAERLMRPDSCTGGRGWRRGK